MLATLVGVVVAAVAVTTVGYAALSKDVTLTLDGRTTHVSAIGDTVGDVLASEGIDLTDKDLVAPAVDETITDGSAIAVQFGRPLEVSVDGESQTYWVNSTNVASALGEIGRRFEGADLSTSRSSSIGRKGLTLQVVTPKVVRIKLGAKDLRKHKVTALTVADVLESMGFEVDRHDKVTPSLTTEIAEGDKVVVKDIRIATQKVKREVVDAPVIEREDPTMYEGDEEVVREGSDGVRKVTYRLRFVNGELVARKVVDADVSVKAVPTIVAVGTKEQPAYQQLRRRQHRLGLPGAVRVRRQLGHQHRQRLLRRPPVQPRHLACVRRHGLPAPGLPRDPDRRRHPPARRDRRLRLVARLRGQARPAPLTSIAPVTPG